jgi:flavin-dependent dehydrogenase
VSSSLEADVVVVGAGPAGSAAAAVLARGGLDVVLVDRSHFPRDKCCGDGLTGRALRRLEQLGLDPGALASFREVSRMRVRSPAGRIVDLPTSTSPDLSPARGRRSFAGVARRLHLDAALAALATEAGARMCEGSALEGVEVRPSRHAAPATGPVTCTLGDGTVLGSRFLVAADGAFSKVMCEGSALEGVEVRPSRHAAPATGPVTCTLGDGTVLGSRFLVAADGAFSKVRALATEGARISGRGAPRAERARRRPWPAPLHAFRTYVTGIGPVAAEGMWVWFEPGLLPGYAWCFPLAGSRANVGICLPRPPGSPGGRLAEAWRDALSATFLDSLVGPGAQLEGPVRSWPIPTGATTAGLVGPAGRVLYAGDAARVADPLSGEGVGQALETGIAAAEAILRHGAAGPEAAASGYVSAVRRKILREQRISAVIATAMSSPPGASAVVAATGTGRLTRLGAARLLFEGLA